MRQKCKILHLPTATYLYRLTDKTEDMYGDNPCYDRLYSEYELDNCINGFKKEEATNIFKSLKQANTYLNHWAVGRRDNPSNIMFDENKTQKTIIYEHCLIIKVEGV